MRIACIVGARPNFMKIAPVIRALSVYPDLETVLIHTGQHYDEAMSRVFFTELELPKPDVYLGVGSGSHTRQTAAVMTKLEELFEQERPHYVLVVGDVNSTLAAGLVAAKMRIRLGHVESGLRSFDREMPEEINRLITDCVADDLFTSCSDAAPNLEKEGVDPARVHFVGNVMIDSLVRHRERAKHSNVLEREGVQPKQYILVTLHRPSNVDHAKVFSGILHALGTLSQEFPVIFPIHPRSRARISTFGLQSIFDGYPEVRLLDPQGYLDFLKLTDNAALVLTDSGGIQEETTYLGVPCLTLRKNTERPVTITQGTNVLVGVDPERIVEAGKRALGEKQGESTIPDLWDGATAERIAAILHSVSKSIA